jgi:hypothetical protein
MATSVVERAWREQSVWSQVANRLKRDLERKRTLALGFTVVGAVLSAAAVAVGLSSGVAKVLAFASAASVAVAGLVRVRTGKRAVQDWTRARSVSEAMKSEVYLYLTRLRDEGDDDREVKLGQRIGDIEDDGSDLLRFKLDVTPHHRPLPQVDDVESYLRVRVGGQLDDYYRPRAAELGRKVTLFRRIELGLGIAGAVLAAAAGTWEREAIAVWVPVVTTVGAAITAHAAAARYEYLLVEYLRTAEELERLRDRRGSASNLTDEALVKKAENIISVQNQGWMAKLTSDDGAGG